MKKLLLKLLGFSSSPPSKEEEPKADEDILRLIRELKEIDQQIKEAESHTNPCFSPNNFQNAFARSCLSIPDQ